MARGRRRQQTPDDVPEGAGVQPNPMQQFVDMLVGALQNWTPNPNNNPPIAPVVSFKDFKSVGPPEFKGTTEPLEAQSWIKEVEKAFVIARVGEE